MKKIILITILSLPLFSFCQQDSLTELGKSYYDRNEISKALDIFDQVLSVDSENAKSLFYRGACYLVIKSNENAIRDFTKLISLNSNLKQAYYLRGLANYQSGDKDEEAINDFTKSISLDLNNDFSFLYRGISYMNQSNYQSAISDFKQATRINDKNDEAWLKMSVSNFFQNNYSAASIEYKKAVELNRENLGEFQLIGLINGMSEANREKAIKAYSIEIENSDNSKNYFLRAEEFRKMENFKSSLSDYNKAISLDNKQLEYFIGRAKLKKALLDYRGGALDAQKAIDLDPKVSSPYIVKADCLLNLDRYDESTSLYSKAIELEPESEEAYYKRGASHLLNGDKEKACLDFSKAGELEYFPAYEAIREHCKN